MAEDTARQPGLEVEILSSFTRQRTRAHLSAGRDYVLGSDAGSDIVVDGTGVAARHALLRLTGAALAVESTGVSRVAVNGQAISAPSPIGDGDWLLLGQTPFQLRVAKDKAAVPSRTPDALPQGPRGSTVLTIGRLPECDFTLPSPLVSRHHARLICEPSQVILEDLGSTNGVFVNGLRIAGSTVLRPGDRVEIATFVFSFTGEALEPVDLSGTVRVQAQGLYKEVRDRTGTRRLLDDIDLAFEPGEFVGVFGSSGSGKSTLLDALSGRRSATGGRVLYNGSSLYDAFDQFRSAIGYVPQQDIVHRRITIDHALRYTARLRLPPDTSTEEIDDHIARVLDRVGLGEKASFRIDTPAPLSGGQLKRVSLAVELVANPNLLFLDEVTSGLDAATDKRMMLLFADLASDRKTVICVTHSLENIDACHLVALLHQGRLVFFGPPADAPEFFGVRRLAEVYDVLETAPAPEWAERFAGSEHYRKYVAARMAPPDDADGVAPSGVSAAMASEHGRAPALSQAGILMRRYLDLLLADRRNLVILLLQAPVIAGVVALVFHSDAPLPARAALHGQVTFVLVLAAIWFGCLNSAREIVKELPVYLRERSVNLRIAPYMASKLVPLAVLCSVQCVLLLCVVAPFVPLDGDTGKRLLALFAAAMGATNMGLAVSAFVGTNDKAIAVVPILLVPQVILADAVVKLQGPALVTAKVTMISFWAFDAAKATLGPDTLGARNLAGQPLVPLSGGYWGDLAAVAALALAFLAVALVGLKLKDRGGR
jgi:ABC-type multidrug transport system ATPase subunit/pSer/pThr/pTyr-binding forkhead associated (FHA) protein